MTYKFYTRLDLINGGNIFRQDDKITLGYIARNSNGEAIDFSGKEIMGTIYNRRAGIMFEAEANFDADSQKIIFTITQTLDHGTFEIEFVVTDPVNANYRVVVPSDEYSGRLDIKPSSANIEVTGVRMVTVEQLRSEQRLAQSTYEEKVDGKVQQLETGFNNHKNAVDLVVEGVQQKASAAETATQTANDAASAANSATSSANTAASSANEQAGAAQQAASDATTASTAANSSADRANTAAENAEGIVDEFGKYKDSAAKAKTFGSVDERFEELEKDSYLPMHNVVNSDLNAMAANYGTLSVTDNILTATGGSVSRITDPYATGNRISGRKYYGKARVRVNNPDADGIYLTVASVLSQQIINPINGTWYEMSGVTTATSNGAVIFQLNTTYPNIETATGKTTDLQYVLFIDLTETFGAGNEPTKAEVDALLAFYTSSWFGGTVNLAENKKLVTFLLNQLRGKANKQQEAWITPTFLNGWAPHGTSQVGYYKDSLGTVHLRGRVSGASAASVIFNLPADYRPSRTINVPVFERLNKVEMLEVTTSGGIYSFGVPGYYISLDGVSFRP